MSSELPPIPEQERVARGTIVQQAAQAVGVVAMLVAITLVGRTLPLEEFGVYGLLVSIGAYLLIVQTSVETATVRRIAAAATGAETDRWFSSAIVLYVAAGVVSGAIIAGGGTALVAVLEIPERLDTEAREGIVALGVVTMLGWPFKVFQDVLRGRQRFRDASIGEILAHLMFVGGTALLLAVDAPLWALVAIGGSLPVLIGVASLVVLAATATVPRFRSGSAHRADMRDLLKIAGGLVVFGAADIVIYAMDRVVLAAFTTAAVIGLFEGIVRPHALVRQVHSTLVITVMPVASKYLAEGDDFRVRELLLRGTRYVMAVVVPLTVALMVLAGPVLDVWLGDEFREAGLAMAILISYWIVGAGTGVAGTMLVADGAIRPLLHYGWAVAAMNLALSLALTPWLGIEGVVLGTAIPYVVLPIWFFTIVTRRFPVTGRELLREAFLPAWALGAALAAGLTVVRLLTPLDTLGGVIATAVVGLGLAYLACYAFVLRDNERALVLTLLGRPRPVP